MLIDNLSQYLKRCRPFPGKTYRVTGCYYNYGGGLLVKSVRASSSYPLEKTLDGLCSLIKDCTLSEKGWASFSKHMNVALQCACYDNGWCFLIRCHRNINGVDVCQCVVFDRAA